MEGKKPEDMSREELLVYCNLLEQKVVFINAEVRKCEANAVHTIAACVIAAGGEVRITPEIVTQLDTAQFARTHDGADSVFSVRQKPTEPERDIAPDAEPRDVLSTGGDPVFYQSFDESQPIENVLQPGWYFYDETWSNAHGPFASEEEARLQLKAYCAQL